MTFTRRALFFNCAFVGVLFGIHPRRVAGRRSAGWVDPRCGPLSEQLAGVALVTGWALQLCALARDVTHTRRNRVPEVIPSFVMTASASLALAAQRSLRSAWRTSVVGTGMAPMATTGPYRLVRHPVYTAMLGVAVGNLLSEPTPLLLAGLAMVVGGLEVQARLVEEPALLVAYGNAYSEYAAKTGRFVPGIG